MSSHTAASLCMLAITSTLLVWGAARRAEAHCDTLDGPVVSAGQQALATGDVNLAALWVQPEQDAELRGAFEHATAVRALGPEAEHLADHHFLETLVRLHRLGEGAPYTGLRPAGLDLGPAVTAADAAVASGELGPVHALLASELEHGLHERWAALQAASGFATDDVEAGRRWVAAYVAYVHYVEGLHQALAGTGHGEHAETPAAAHPAHSH
jgi:hypothetical protein